MSIKIQQCDAGGIGRNHIQKIEHSKVITYSYDVHHYNESVRRGDSSKLGWTECAFPDNPVSHITYTKLRDQTNQMVTFSVFFDVRSVRGGGVYHRHKTIDELIDSGLGNNINDPVECNWIPNCLGINLGCVNSVEWLQIDNQLLWMVVYFCPSLYPDVTTDECDSDSDSK